MSVSVILSQLEALVTKMELVGSRLCNKRIRPTADQLNDFQNLHTRFKATLANFDTGIQKLYPSKILASSESTSLEKHHVSLAFPNQFVLRSPHVIAAGYKPISHTNACPSLMTYVRDKGVSFQGTGATDKQLEVSLVVEIDNGSLPSDKILNDWGPNMLSCGERPGRGSDAFDTMTRRIRNARFADVHEKDYKSPMRPWPRNQEMKGAGMVNFQHSMNEIRGLVYVVAHKVWPPATLESPCVCREAAKRAQRRFHICIKGDSKVTHAKTIKP
ncbi:Pc24g02220 [Penicillium rubens Wisconsin 54-1255]|uniref:Pc24g02220 protein n=1 Tax=Penicillium rubens (strain ATCC 28089 / DSM 1075 / NRRL 1951 / Wisconsin 54-1255) TaxID=500485 RepID=B6HX02_PENRW|nr:Pc24g02220 [Penicillium rubens Wisconsin 54-1255]